LTTVIIYFYWSLTIVTVVNCTQRSANSTSRVHRRRNENVVKITAM